MIQKKELVSRILCKGKLDRLLLPLSSYCLTILNYHRILPDQTDFRPEFDDGVFGVRVSVFEQQIRWLRDNCEILGEDEIIDFVKKNRIPRRGGVVVTFDDGYLDNYTLAYPILSRYCIPAIFFIATGITGDRTVGWWDQIAYLIKKSAKPHIESDDRRFDLNVDKGAAISHFVDKMALSPAGETRHLIKDLAKICGVALPSKKTQSDELMSWEQIRELAGSGMTIGSHTVTHRVLSTLSADEQREEFVKSKTELERRLDRSIRSLAYPVGGYRHFTPETTALAKQVGYELAFSYNTGVNRFRISNPHDVRRVSPMEDLSMFACSCALPEVFFWYERKKL